MKSHHSQYKLLESPHYIYFTNLVQFAFPIIKNLVKIYDDSGQTSNDIKKSNDLSNYIAEWLMGFQIGDMMIIDYLDFNELKSRTGIDDEISVDLLLEKICFLTISAYCIGTEMRMLSNQKFSKYVINDAKEFYGISAKYAEFLPRNSLLYTHINLTYTKHFGEVKAEKKIKEISVERIKKKSASPDIEKIYKPKSLKSIKKVSPMKKIKNHQSAARITPNPGVKKGLVDSIFTHKAIAEQFIGNRNEPDPETIVE